MLKFIFPNAFYLASGLVYAKVLIGKDVEIDNEEPYAFIYSVICRIITDAIRAQAKLKML